MRRSPRLTAGLIGPPRSVRSPHGRESIGARNLAARSVSATAVAHGVELVVAGHLLHEHAAAVVLEDDEVAEQREQPLRRADALEEHAQLQRGHLGEALARDRAPRLEPLPPRRERAEARLRAVRDDEQLVHREQRGQLGLVGLELLPRRPDVGLLVGRVLELDHAERQAVDEQHDVRAARVLALGDGDLVDRQEVVGGGAGVVDDGGLRAADRAAGGAVLDVHARDEHAVEGAVARLEGRALGPGQLAEGVVERVAGQVRVEPREGVAQSPLQHDGAVVGALLTGRTGADVGPVRGLPAEGGQPLKRGVLDIGFGEGGHGLYASIRRSPLGSGTGVAELPRRHRSRGRLACSTLCRAAALGVAVGAATGKLGHLRDEGRCPRCSSR